MIGNLQVPCTTLHRHGRVPSPFDGAPPRTVGGPRPGGRLQHRQPSVPPATVAPTCWGGTRTRHVANQALAAPRGGSADRGTARRAGPSFTATRCRHHRGRGGACHRAWGTRRRRRRCRLEGGREPRRPVGQLRTARVCIAGNRGATVLAACRHDGGSARRRQRCAAPRCAAAPRGGALCAHGCAAAGLSRACARLCRSCAQPHMRIFLWKCLHVRGVRRPPRPAVERCRSARLVRSNDGRGAQSWPATRDAPGAASICSPTLYKRRRLLPSLAHSCEAAPSPAPHPPRGSPVRGDRNGRRPHSALGLSPSPCGAPSSGGCPFVSTRVRQSTSCACL